MQSNNGGWKGEGVGGEEEIEGNKASDKFCFTAASVIEELSPLIVVRSL